MIRAGGFSRAKILAIRDIAAKTLAGVVPTSRQIAKLSDDEIIERLTEVRGVGRWTVEMLLIFQLGRPDVLPADDFGVRNGFRMPTAGVPCRKRRNSSCLANAGVHTAPPPPGTSGARLNRGAKKKERQVVDLRRTYGLRKVCAEVRDGYNFFFFAELWIRTMKHLLSLEKLPRADFEKILHAAAVFKRERGHHANPTAGRPDLGVDVFQIVHAHAGFVRGRHPRTRRAADVSQRQ